MAIRLETTTDTVEEVKKAIGEVADDLVGEVETKPEEGDKKPSESGAASETAEHKEDPKEKASKDDEPSTTKEDDIPPSVKAQLGKLRQDRRELRERVAKLERERETPKPAAKTEPAQVSYSGKAKPKRDDFQSTEDPDSAYFEALAEWTASEKLAARDAKRDSEAAAREVKEATDAYTERLVVAHERYEDFDETFEELDDDVIITPIMQYACLSSDLGPDMSYYLAKHPEVAKRIASAEPSMQIKEMGKVEQKVEDIVAGLVKKAAKEEKTEDPPRKPSQAPKPTTPLKTASPSTSKSNTEQNDDNHVDHAKFDKDYEKRRNDERKHRA